MPAASSQSVQRELERLKIIHYPDPRLRKPAQAVERFDEGLAALVERMFALMREAKGVGLAAPQLGIPLRLFVMNPTPEPENARAFVNPVIRETAGVLESEEGCLSIPSVHVTVRRAQRCTIEAHDLRGRPFTEEGADLVARVWQHETDHLNGVLILDRMGPSDRIAVRKTLKSLEEAYHERRGK